MYDVHSTNTAHCTDVIMMTMMMIMIIMMMMIKTRRKHV